jgi:hypothetical protein
VTGWRKSSYSGGAANDCVEIASDNGTVIVRDTKDRGGTTLTFGAGAWATFVSQL